MLTAPTAISAIRPALTGPTFSPGTSQPIKAANTVQVSRRTAAPPTLSGLVAGMIEPKPR